MWDKVKGIIGSAAPVVGTLLGGPAGAAMGSIIADTLGVANEPSAIERALEKNPDALLKIGFMKDDKADHMMMGLRRILSRGRLTEDDTRIMMGIARQSIWASGI